MKMSCFPEHTNKDLFENGFLMSLSYRGQTCNSLEEVTKLLENKYPGMLFKNVKLVPVVSENHSIFVSVPFGYVYADVGAEKITNPEYLGFKLDCESFFRLGPPHFESTRERVCFGDTDGHRIYESSEKKYELATFTDI